MQHLPIHPSGPTFSRIIAGAWRWNSIGTDAIEKLINTALDEGITTFDHADIYGDYSNEQSFGEVLGRQPQLVKKMQLVTKCGIKLTSSKKPEHRVKHYDSSKEHILLSAENSLKNLRTDHIDLLLIHRPDPLMDIHEVADAFTQLKKGGKVLSFGVSNFTTSQFDLLQSALSFPLVTNQIELSLFCMAPLFDGTIEHLYKHKVSAMAWSPLGGGRLYRDGDEAAARVRAACAEMAPRYASAAQGGQPPSADVLAMAWILALPAEPLVVVGTNKLDRVRAAAAAASIRLAREDWYALWTAAQGRGIP